VLRASNLKYFVLMVLVLKDDVSDRIGLGFVFVSSLL
jgi:hypothetical protein